MSGEKAPRVPPRWFVVGAWKVHRALFAVTRGRRGLWPERPAKWGTMRLTVVGRRSGQERSVILGYLEDGPDVVTLAMNGWAAPEPAWWLNLQAQPDVTVDLRDGPRRFHAREATGDERARLWAAMSRVETNLDAYATRRPRGTSVVVFEPTSEQPPALMDQA